MADEAAELGVSILMLAGGEPLMRPVLFELAARHPQIAMPVVTNGLLIDDATIARFQAHRNLIPVISLEGHAGAADDRRGAGVHAYLLGVIARLRAAGLFYGASLTVTQANYDLLTSPAYARELADLGCRLFFYVEYVPIEPHSEERCLTAEQKAGLPPRLGRPAPRPARPVRGPCPAKRSSLGALPGRGRGFLHISAEGRRRALPLCALFRRQPAPDALAPGPAERPAARHPASDVHLSETQGGCALWVHREWVESLLAQPQRGLTPYARPGRPLHAGGGRQQTPDRPAR